MEEKYNAGLISQSFWFIEFKKIVELYHNGADFEEIKRQCIEENLFGAINPNREKRMCGYLLTRLRSMNDRLKVLLPITSAADLGSVPPELMGNFSIIFYNSAEDTVFKALGVE